MKPMQKFFLLWGSQLLSLLGSELSSFGMAVWIYERTGQATPFAIAAILSRLPDILLSPIAGAVVDRFPRKRLIMLTDSIAALFTIWLFILLRADNLQLGQIYIIILGQAIMGTFQRPAKTALISMLLPKEEYARAAGLNQTSEALGPLLSPLLAGILVVRIGLGGIIMIDLVTFVIAVLVLLPIVLPELSHEERLENSQSSWLADSSAGFRYLWQKRGLFVLLCYFALVNFLLSGLTVMLGPYALAQGGAETLGIVQTSAGLGMLIGSLVMGAWGGTKHRLLAIVGAIQCMALALILVGLSANLWLLAGTLFLTLFFPPIASAHSAAIFLSQTPAQLQGRVAAARNMLASAMAPLGMIGAAWMADHVFNPLLMPTGLLVHHWLGQIFGTGEARGIGLMFAIAGVSMFALGLLVITLPILRKLDEEAT